MVTRTPRTKTALVAALGLSLVLTGCSGGSSVESSCETVQSGISTIAAEMNPALSELGQNPEEAKTLLEGFAADLGALAKEAKNDEVRASVEELGGVFTALTEFTGDLDGGLGTEDAAGLADLMRDYESASVKLAKLCS